MGREKSQGELLAEISLKLDSILAFMAAKTPQSEQGALVEKLSGYGLSADAIGTYLARYSALLRLREALYQFSWSLVGRPPE